MPASSQYHVILDGQGYLVDLDSYRKTVHDPFAPKRRSGDPGYGDLSLPSVWAQENWQLGFGEDYWRPSWSNREAGYDLGVSIDAHFGDLRLGRVLTTRYNPGSGTATALEELLQYNGSLFATVGAPSTTTAVKSSTDGTTWAASLTLASADTLRRLAIFNGLLIAASNNTASAKLHKFDGTTWTDTWVTITGGADILAALAVYPINGTDYLWVGTRQTATGTAQLTQVHSSGTQTAMASLRDPYIETLAAWDGLLWIATKDDRSGQLRGALYTYDGTKLTEITQLPDNCITAFAEYGGKLYAGSITRGKVWTVDRNGLTEVWTIPNVDGIGGVSTYAQPMRALGLFDGRLLVPVVDTDGLGVYAFDGAGWSNIIAGGAGDAPRVVAPFKSSLYLTNQASTGARVYEAESKAPTSGTWVSSSFSAGLAATEKVWQKLELYHKALNADESLTVDYELDGSGIWTNLGLSDTDGATSKSFTFATAIKSKRIRIRIQVALVTQTATPKITGILVHYLVAPDVKAEWTCDVRLEGTAETPLRRLDNSNEPTTGTALADALWTSRAKKQTLSFTDLDAEVKTVWFVDLDERVAKGTQRQTAQTLGKIRLVEA